MPRDVRKSSESGIYHIMLRGINRQDIFADEEDIQRLIETIIRFKDVSKYELFAYCIMSNHVHFLIRESGEPISNAIKRISSSYVYWYNKKYERCGHLFQERFKSEAVNSDEYFLTVLRYIHQNPIKAGMSKDIAKYKWSSYIEYIEKATLTDTDFALNIFSQDRKTAIDLFDKFNNQNNNDICLEYDDKVIVSDNDLKELILLLGIRNITELHKLEKIKRNEILKKLKSINRVTVRQLSRFTGISKSVIHRA